MNVPPKDQLIDHDGLDERYVIKHWNGKNSDEAYKMFAEGASLYCEDITYMSVAALHYYLPAAFAYLQSSDSNDDWECASGVMTSLSCVCSRRDLTSPVVGLIRHITNYVADNLAKFDADDDWVPTLIHAVRKHIPHHEAPGEQDRGTLFVCKGRDTFHIWQRRLEWYNFRQFILARFADGPDAKNLPLCDLTNG